MAQQRARTPSSGLRERHAPQGCPCKACQRTAGARPLDGVSEDHTWRWEGGEWLLGFTFKSRASQLYPLGVLLKHRLRFSSFGMGPEILHFQ